MVDSGGSLVEPDVHYDNQNQVTLTFGSPTSGKAYLNPGGGTEDMGIETMLYTQAAPATVWNITHNFGRYPSVTVSDVFSNYVVADIHYVDVDNLQITFPVPVAGRAYLV